MATIAEKDVLLEYVSFGYLTIGMDDEQTKKDLSKAGELWEKILMTDLQDLDFEKTRKEIKELRARYERK